MTNVAPVVDMNGPASGTLATVGAVRGGQAVLIGTTATVTDTDSPDFNGGTLNVYVSNAAFGDTLAIQADGAGAGQISVSGDQISYGGVHFATLRQPNTGGGPSTPNPSQLLMDLNSNANAAAVQALLRRLSYQLGQNGSADNSDRYVAVYLRDGDGGENSQAGTIVTLSSSNRPPVVTASTYVATFVEAASNGPPQSVVVDPYVRADDPDGTTLASAIVQISGGLRSSEDRLELPNAGAYGLVASYNEASGTLQISAARSPVGLSQWNAALSSVRYTNLADEPTGGARQISFTVNDGAASSPAATGSLNVVTTTDPTVVDLDADEIGRDSLVLYTEQQAPTLLAPRATVVDPDTPNFGGGRLTVSHWDGRGDARDNVTIRNIGTGAGQIGVSGTTVTFAGVAIGTVSGGIGQASPLTVALNTAATPAAVQALLRSVQYYNGSDSPPGRPLYNVVLTDGAGAASMTAQVTVNITQVDDPTDMDLNGAAAGVNASAVYRIGSEVVEIAPAAVITDDDNDNFRGGSLTVRLLNGQPGDVIGIINQGLGTGQIYVEGDYVAWSGLRFGRVYPLQGLVVFEAQNVPEAAVQGLIRAIGFSNTSADPSTAPRILEVSLLPKQGAETLVAQVSLTVTASPDRVVNGTDGADVLTGGIGNDVLNGMGGDDRIDGGGGIDTAVFSGFRGAYRLSHDGNGTVQVVGPDGADTLTNVEHLRFGDALLGVPDRLFDQTAKASGGFGTDPAAGGWTTAGRYPRVAADINGDGYDDLIGFGDAGVYVQRGDGQGGFGASVLASRQFGNGAQAGGWESQDRHPRMVADVNGDGRGDLVGFGNAGVYVALARTDGSFGAATLASGDFGADARAGGWDSAGAYPRTLADINGDGRADIVAFGNAGTYVALGSSNGSFGAMRLAIAEFGRVAGDWSGQDRYPRLAADINGDGRADLVGFGEAGTYVALADGAGGFGAMTMVLREFGAGAGAGGWGSQGAFPRAAADVNGDGLADLIGFGTAGTYVALGRSTGFGPMTLVMKDFGASADAGGWSSADLFPRTLADIDGDNRADIVGFGRSGVFVATAAGFDPVSTSNAAAAPVDADMQIIDNAWLVRTHNLPSVEQMITIWL